MKLIEDWEKHLKSYSFISLIANVLVASAYGLSMALGVGITFLSPFWVITLMGIVAIFGSIGKFIKQFEKDTEEQQ